jgi:CubicO group peptidase (beta-lactamase class C family)
MLHEQIHQYLLEKTKADEPGCVVVVVKNGEVIHRAGYGLANLEWEIPNSPETVFQLASTTKQVTAVAIMMLVEEGKLSLNDPITTFFPDFSTSGHHVTVTHLLNHTSGIKDNTSLPDFEKLMRYKFSPEEFYQKFAHLPFDFAPEEKWRYNNSGYHMLGMIIEKVSGLSYEDFIKSRIFEPLDMKTARYIHNETIIPHRASGYEKEGDGFVNAEFMDMSIAYAVGSMGASVDDLVKWDKALRENRLISAESLRLMHQPTILKDGTSEDYGFGWGLGNYQGYKILMHGGTQPGFLNQMMHVFEEGAMAAVLCNSMSLNPEVLCFAVLRHALDIPLPTYTPISLSPEQLACVEGEFQMGEQKTTIQVLEDGKVSSPQFSYSSPFLPYSETEFYSLTTSDVTLVFDDNFSTMTLKWPFKSFVLKRVEKQAE